jgi:single-stranded-DNA-specific exonuclease
MVRQEWKRRALRWEVAPIFTGADAMANKMKNAPLVAQILHNRGIDDPDKGRSFLAPKLTELHDPLELTGVGVAAKRLAEAAMGGEKIVIYGDYDVDGMTGTAILHQAISLVGGNVSFYVPHRIEEGYGVNPDSIRQLIADGAKLIVTVDCGSSAGDVLSGAVSEGCDVIVTDHHIIHGAPPNVTAVVHPTLTPPEGAEPYGNPYLCGAGVAFKLAWEMLRGICGTTRVSDEMRKFLLDATCLAALGTITDVVPLVGENRVLATFGLKGLPAARHIGIRALLESANLMGETLDAYHVGFVIGPRLNAAGRMGHAQLAVELLTTNSPERAREIADYLIQQNTQRQNVERKITKQAREMVQSSELDAKENCAIVLANEGWHAGVIGIVASRMVDRFHRPTVIISIDGDVAQGSARSIDGFHMSDALTACEEHLISYGGHAMAAGLKVATDKIDDFTQAFAKYAREHLSESQLTPTLRIDAETTISALSHNVVDQLERLAPFGPKNPRPIVALQNCTLLGAPKRMGRSGNTVGMLLQQGTATMRAVGFNMGDLADALAGVRNVSVAAQPVLNYFNGKTNVELRISDVTWN